MSHIDDTVPIDAGDMIAPKTRTRLYIGFVVGGAAAFLGASIAPEFGADPDASSRILGYVNTTLLMLSGGLAIGYRPTR